MRDVQLGHTSVDKHCIQLILNKARLLDCAYRAVQRAPEFERPEIDKMLKVPIIEQGETEKVLTNLSLQKMTS